MKSYINRSIILFDDKKGTLVLQPESKIGINIKQNYYTINNYSFINTINLSLGSNIAVKNYE